MKQYLDLLRDILENGTRKEQRAALSDGTKPQCLSVFGRQIRFNLQDGFPLVTTKQMSFRIAVHELIWFLRGDPNIKYLQQNNVNIWDKWANKYGNLGAVYPYTWRHFEGECFDADQVATLFNNIRNVIRDPNHYAARRLIITSWHPADQPMPDVPTGCHTLAQWNITDGKLSCQLYQRSGDAFLGIPYNIAVYSLFTHILAHLTGLQVGEFIHTFGDAHIYANHLEQVREQITREPLQLPTLWLSPELKSLDSIDASMIRLDNYKYHPKLKGEVAV